MKKIDLSQLNNLSISPVIIQKLNYPTNLTYLESYCNKNLSILPDIIGKLFQLKILILRSSNLTILPDSIGNLSQLKILDLRSNKLSTLPNNIGKLFQLEELYLSYNKLTFLPDTIGNLLQLKKLWLFNNNLSPEEQNKIKKLLPNTKILF